MKILVTDYAWANLDVEKSVLYEIGAELISAPDGEEKTLVQLAQGCCGIMTCWAQTTRAVIASALPDLKVIVRYGVGLDNIDVAYATEQGIPVANVPDYCFIDVAEQTMALLLGLSHKVAQFDRLIRRRHLGYPGGLTPAPIDRSGTRPDRIWANCARGRPPRPGFWATCTGLLAVFDTRTSARLRRRIHRSGHPASHIGFRIASLSIYR